MKYTLMFKTPDVLDQLNEEVKYHGLTQEEQFEELQRIKELGEKFITYNEYCYIELDTEAMTFKLLEN